HARLDQRRKVAGNAEGTRQLLRQLPRLDADERRAQGVPRIRDQSAEGVLLNDVAPPHPGGRGISAEVSARHRLIEILLPPGEGARRADEGRVAPTTVRARR